MHNFHVYCVKYHIDTINMHVSGELKELLILNSTVKRFGKKARILPLPGNRYMYEKFTHRCEYFLYYRVSSDCRILHTLELTIRHISDQRLSQINILISDNPTYYSHISNQPMIYVEYKNSNLGKHVVKKYATGSDKLVITVT